MEDEAQELKVKQLQDKLDELKEQRIRADMANETLRKRIETLSEYMDGLSGKYNKENNTSDTNGNDSEITKPEIDAKGIDENIEECESKKCDKEEK